MHAPERVSGHVVTCPWHRGKFDVRTGEVVGAPPQQRSRITNGSALLPGVDGRSPWVRRCKDVIAAHLSDLGGVDNCSAAERSIIRRASVLTVEFEQLEARFATAGEASADDLDLYQKKHIWTLC